MQYNQALMRAMLVAEAIMRIAEQKRNRERTEAEQEAKNKA